MNMHVDLYDVAGTNVLSVHTDPIRAALTAASFVWIHGSDPDEDGEGAQIGMVGFGPTEAPPPADAGPLHPGCEDFLVEALDELLTAGTDGKLLRRLLVLLQRHEGD